MYNNYLIPFWQDKIYDNNVWKNIYNIPNDVLWNTHLTYKKKLIEEINRNVRTRMSENGATYDEIAETVGKINENDLIIGFAGKAHPADVMGQELIKRIDEVSKMPQFKGKIMLLENYNMGLSRMLVAGVDVWMNNPRRPYEASRN